MSRDINPFGLRMPVDLRSALEAAAKEGGRSLNAEIVWRLQCSFDPGTETRMLETRIRERESLTMKKRSLAAESFLLKTQPDASENGVELAERTAAITARNSAQIARIDDHYFRISQEIDSLMEELAQRLQTTRPRKVKK